MARRLLCARRPINLFKNAAARVPVPWRFEPKDVAEAPGGVEKGSGSRPSRWVSCPVLKSKHDILIKHVFGDHPSKSKRGRDDMIDKSGLYRTHLDISDAGFADRPDFELFAINR